MGRIRVDSVFLHIVQLSYAALFLAGAISKFRHLSEFHRVLDEYEFLPSSLVPLASRLIPTLELVTSLALLIAPIPVAVLLSMALLGLYTIAMGNAILKGRSDLDCGCHFGGQRQAVSSLLVFRNLLLIMLTFAMVVPAEEHALSMMDFVAIAFGVILSATIYQLVNQLISNEDLNRSFTQ